MYCNHHLRCPKDKSPSETYNFSIYFNRIAVGPADITSDYQYNDYAAAEYLGRHHGDCEDIYRACPVSFLKMISYVTDE